MDSDKKPIDYYELGTLDWASRAPDCVVKHLGQKLTGDLLLSLSRFKFEHNLDCHRKAVLLVLQLFIGIAVEQGWSRSHHTPGFLTKLSEDAIARLCAGFTGGTYRGNKGWAAHLGLKYAREWRDVWSPRFEDLMVCMKALGKASNDLMREQRGHKSFCVFRNVAPGGVGI